MGQGGVRWRWARIGWAKVGAQKAFTHQRSQAGKGSIFLNIAQNESPFEGADVRLLEFERKGLHLLHKCLRCFAQGIECS